MYHRPGIRTPKDARWFHDSLNGCRFREFIEREKGVHSGTTAISSPAGVCGVFAAMYGQNSPPDKVPAQRKNK